MKSFLRRLYHKNTILITIKDCNIYFHAKWRLKQKLVRPCRFIMPVSFLTMLVEHYPYGIGPGIDADRRTEIGLHDPFTIKGLLKYIL